MILAMGRRERRSGRPKIVEDERFAHRRSGARRGPHPRRRGAGTARTGRSRHSGRVGRRVALAQAPAAGGDLHHRPQPQPDQRVHHGLRVLRLLRPAQRLGQGLRTRPRDHLPQDPGDGRRRRGADPDAGRPPSLPQSGVVRRAAARHQGALAQAAPARHEPARDRALGQDLEDRHARGHPPAASRRHGQHSRRRSRDPGRARAPRDRAQEGHHRGMAAGDARGPRGGPEDHRHHDVRARGDGSRPHRAPAAAARPAGRDRRLHRLHRLDLPARRQRDGRSHAGRRLAQGRPRRVFPHYRGGPRVPGQFHQSAGFVRHPGRRRRHREPAHGLQRLRQRHAGRERGLSSRLPRACRLAPRPPAGTRARRRSSSRAGGWLPPIPAATGARARRRRRRDRPSPGARRTRPARLR